MALEARLGLTSFLAFPNTTIGSQWRHGLHPLLSHFPSFSSLKTLLCVYKETHLQCNQVAELNLISFPSSFKGTATVSEKKDNNGIKEVKKDEEEDEAANEENEVCEDKISNIAGSLSCKNFLRSFAYQYCRHKYIRKNCCASHKIYCRRGRRGRRLQQVPSSKIINLSRRY